LSTGSFPLPFSATYAGDADASPGNPSGMTPASVTLYALPHYPGVYHGSLTITSPPGSTNSVVVPVTAELPPVPVMDPIRPKISAVVNAGSLLPGAIAPGEIVTVFGLVQAIGTAGTNIGSDGRVNRALYAIRVLFNGIPAPLTYLSPSQINAVVPYEIAG